MLGLWAYVPPTLFCRTPGAESGQQETAPIPASSESRRNPNAGGDWNRRMRTIEVAGLGWDGAIVDIEGQQILLLDANLSWDQRMDVMTEAMADASSS